MARHRPRRLRQLGVREATAGGQLQIGQNDGTNASATQWINESGATISATDATLELTDRWINEGTITASDSSVDLGGSYDYSDNGRWLNEGTITVSGGSLTLGAANVSDNTFSNWTNTGTIAADDAAITLDGNETFADLGELTRNGGSIALSGSLDMGGTALDATSGLFQNLELDGGTLANTTVTQGAGGALSFSGSNTLSNVTVIGGLSVDDAAVTLDNGSTVEDASGAKPGAISLANSSLVLQGYDELVNNVTL